ncbi:MAG TPA: NAD-dependent protein deacetylase [Micromonosporaceae bacterium]
MQTTPAPSTVTSSRQERGLERLAELLSGGGVVVLSGAGLSTESGIPDYRGETGAQRRGQPMTYQTFTRDAVARRRYWARSHLGWRTIGLAAPNSGHDAVTALQSAGVVDGIITQNVDGLHQASGAHSVIELHGNLARVICLHCGELMDRGELDRRLREANPTFDATIAAVNPDGDVELADADLAGFHAVECGICLSGVLKPDVVFFGENVPRARVTASFDLVESARALLVLGSSLTVMSGRRFVLRAMKLGIPVAIVNMGTTRESHRADIVIDARLGMVLPEVVRAIKDAGAAAK